MTYLSVYFYLFVIFLWVIYYAIPIKYRWLVLVIGSVMFYCQVSGQAVFIVSGTILWSYLTAMAIKKYSSVLILWVSIIGMIVPWIIIKNGNFLLVSLFQAKEINLIVPLGISFYTLQMISYVIDVYREEIEPQENFLKYVLFVMFFPQIVQGPIPRYSKLSEQLYGGHSFDEKQVIEGFQLVLWGFFLKLVIADKAAIIVSAVFADYHTYGGFYIWIAGILYSIELYADFLACVTISQGVSAVFGIKIENNFEHPYLAESIKEFWKRWHLSLSKWLRDYIYIPLGGNRKGKLRKYANLGITFLISGIWHGAGYKFVLWGIIHGIYQIVGDITRKYKNRIYEILCLQETDTQKIIKKVGTFFWVMLEWIVFIAESLRDAINMILSMFKVWNPWVCFDNSLLKLGLNLKECVIFGIAILLLFVVDVLQEKGMCIRAAIGKRHIVLQWIIYIAAIVFIMTFGTYGFGYSAQDFIYGAF